MQFEISINGNPLTEVLPIEKPKKAMIYYHGFGSSKEKSLFRAKILSNLGYHVIVPDAIGHGLRINEKKLDYNNPNEDFWDTLIHTITESPDLINYLCEKKGFSPKDIVFCGHSMGAMAAAGVFVKTPFGKLICYNGCLDYNGLARYFYKALRQDDDEFKRINDKLIYYNPREYITKLENRPILIVDGAQDRVVPYRFNEEVVSVIRPFYKNKEDLEHVIINNSGHEMTVRSVELAQKFI